MRYPVRTAHEASIPLFAEKPSHPFVPLGEQTAGARSEGQGRRFAGASRAPLTAASTLAGLPRNGDRMVFRYVVFLLACVIPAATFDVIAFAQPMTTERVVRDDGYVVHIAEASRRFGIPVAWIRAVMRIESTGDVRAISPKGAMGLMQLMPDTWAELRGRYALGRDPYDPRDNILAGTAYLREMFDRYGNVAAMLAAYNAGPGRYDEHLSTGRPLPAETRAYVASILPLIGAGDSAEPVMVATADPNGWRRASLFVARSTDRHTADSTQSVQRSTDMPATPPVRDVSAIEPRSDGLFFVRASAGEPQ
ncbi:MAG: lytic transglycosylase domain-containing protein [Pseudomonadota bacterium]